MPMTASMPSPCSSDSPESGLSGSDDLNRLIQFALFGCAPGSDPLAQAHHKYCTDDFGRNLDRGVDFADLVDYEDVGNQHAACDPAQQSGTERDDQGEAVDQFQHQCTAPDDDGHADDQTEDHIVQLMIGVRVLRGPGNGNDVIQTHDEVGDEDGLDRAPDRRRAGDVAVLVFVGQKQLDPDPQQQQATHDLEEGNVEQHQGERDERHPQGDRTGRTPQNALHALLRRKVATCQRDDDGIVTTEQDVDHDDLENRPPMERLKKL